CLGGGDEESNLAVLTLKEHFICHYLLTRMYPDNTSINVAFSFMINRTKGKNAKGYEKYRKYVASQTSERFKEYWKDEDKLKANSERMKELMKDSRYLKKIEE